MPQRNTDSRRVAHLEENAPASVCLHCHRRFTPTRTGHIYCRPACRHRGPRRPDDPALASSEELRRLFDGRPDAERVVADDRHPSGSDSEWARLRATDTLGLRRRWFTRLAEEGA